MRMNSRPVSLLILSAILLGFNLLSAADGDVPPAPRRPGQGDDGQGPGPRGPRFQQGQFRPGGFQPGRGGGVPLEAVLTEEQREKFGEEMLAQREKSGQLNPDEKFMKLRRELDQALFGEKLDEELVRKKSAELAAVDLERSLIRARAFAKIRPSLSEEQLERLKQMRAEMGRGPQGGQGGEFRGPPDGVRPGGRRPQGRPPGDDGDDVLPPPAPRPPAAPAK